MKKLPKPKLKKLGREKAWGICDYVKRNIQIDPRHKQKAMLDTLIHESLHWLEPDWSENKVKQVSKQLTKVIWDFNYRQLR